MRFQRTLVSGFSQVKNRAPFLLQTQASRYFSPLPSDHPQSRPSFGIAFDIDGVILRGSVPIGGSPRALARLYADSGSLKVPFLFLTNGGGVPESRRATELSELLGVKILPSQILQGHSPFRNLLERYQNQLVVATGKGEPAVVMLEYGFKKVISLDDYASLFENIDPVHQYKKWTTKQMQNGSGLAVNTVPTFNVTSEAIKAVFVVSDPVDWGRDIQVLCDILRSGGLPGQYNVSEHQPPLYFAADDLQYQAAFPSERLGMGAFRIALESVFNRIHHHPLDYVCFGKPNPFVFKNAEAVLRQLQASSHPDDFKVDEASEAHSFKTLYMIGDNPPVDIKGARQAGHPWFSILTRTGVFRGKVNHAEFPADLMNCRELGFSIILTSYTFPAKCQVVDTVEEAVDYILRRECSC